MTIKLEIWRTSWHSANLTVICHPCGYVDRSLRRDRSGGTRTVSGPIEWHSSTRTLRSRWKPDLRCWATVAYRAHGDHTDHQVGVHEHPYLHMRHMLRNHRECLGHPRMVGLHPRDRKPSRERPKSRSGSRPRSGDRRRSSDQPRCDAKCPGCSALDVRLANVVTAVQVL
eukprot:2478898-Amphidinium_carterae.2